MDKPATTQQPIHELIARRWSPRAFDGSRALATDDIVALLEAARWAPSCFGEEPWRYLVCDMASDEGAWATALSCLAGKNQQWAQHAPLLLLALAADNFSHNGKPNRWSQYDTGAASENLCLQATALGLVAHQMGGFDAAMAQQLFAIPDEFSAMAMIAVGYAAPTAAHLDPELEKREQAPRSRQPLGECFFAGAWGKPFSS